MSYFAHCVVLYGSSASHEIMLSSKVLHCIAFTAFIMGSRHVYCYQDHEMLSEDLLLQPVLADTMISRSVLCVWLH